MRDKNAPPHFCIMNKKRRLRRQIPWGCARHS